MKRLWQALSAVAIGTALIACGGGDDDSSSSSGSSTPGSSTAATGKIALDSAFGTGGLDKIVMSPTTHDRFMAVAAGADGKTYAAGFTLTDGDQSMAVARLGANGGLDKTFGKDGIATVNVAVGGRTAELARSVAVLSNGKILIGGPFEHDPAAAGDAARDTDIAVARFNADGTLDSSFGTAGVAKVDLGTGRITTGTTFGADTSWGLAVGSGDKVYVMASMLADAPRTDSDYVIVGLTANGQLDTSFATGGKFISDGGGNNTDNPRGIMVQPDGKIVGTGYSTIDGVVQPALIRLNANGQRDTTFGTNGIATAKVLGGVAESYMLGMQGNNYVLAGYGRDADTAQKVDLVAYRFNANGQWDQTFGTSGVFRLDIAGDDDRARTMMVLPDQRIVIAGSGKKTALDIDAMIVVLTKDGARDSTFGENGVLIQDLGGPADAWFGITLSADKKHIIAVGYKGVEATGSGNDDAVVTRLTIS